MVKAILKGQKTQTRRIVKPQPLDDWQGIKKIYQPGDRLYVRETWFRNEECLLYKASKYENTKAYHGRNGWVQIKWRPSIFMPREAARIWLEVTSVRVERLQEINWKDALAEGIDHSNGEDDEICDFCPLEDGHKGVKNYGKGPVFCFDGGPCDKAQAHFEDDCIDCFSELWDSLNSKRGYGWHTNPWVWVIEFKRVEGDAK
jgi:hypothetical protein